MNNTSIQLKLNTLALISSEVGRDPLLKSEHTRRAYISDLAAFEAWRAGRDTTKLLVEEYAAELQKAGRSPNTINRKLTSIRWWVRRWAERAQEQPANTDEDRLLRSEQVAQAERVANVRSVKGTRQKRGRHIPSGELAALMAACQADTTPAGLRDAAMIALASGTGMRQGEITGLMVGDFTITEDEEGTLLINGKGDKQRTAFLYNGAYYALVDWLQMRGTQPGAVFCAINKSGALQPGRRISGEAMRLILDKRVEDAKVNPLTWHDFRRTFAGNLLTAHHDLATVQKLMGHADPRTTAEYDRRDETTQRKAVKSLFVPYTRRVT